MAQNLPTKKIFNFIVNDFEGAWNSIAINNAPIGRGNFMFAKQAMILLEVVARLCKKDPKAFEDLSKTLGLIEPKYFTRIPGLKVNPGLRNNAFKLPCINNKRDILLWALFDLIRNGQAHQYQQIIAELRDNKHLVICLTGPDSPNRQNPPMTLDNIKNAGRDPNHLGYQFDSDGDLILLVRTDWLFLDIQEAIEKSGILKKGLSFNHLTVRSKNYDFTTKDLQRSIDSAGHKKL